jgi:RNA polymerase sigma-70 factor (ECF subfamily)
MRALPAQEDAPVPQSGERAALERMLEQYLPRLRAFLRSRMDPALRAREWSADLAQSVCRELLDHASRFELQGEAQFRSWLFTAALNKVRERARFWGRERRDAAAEAGEPPDSALVDAYAALHSPSRVAAGHELVETIERALDRLSDDQREVVTLSRLVGLSHAEIAAVLGKSEGAVRMLLSRGLVALVAEIDRIEGVR